MKRIIRYHNIYSSDKAEFSTCSTKYKIVEGLYSDDAGIEELRAKAKELGLKTRGAVDFDQKSHGSREIEITHALILVGKVETRDGFRDEVKTHTEYLGFVKLVENDTLPAKESLDNTVPKNSLHDILNGSNAYALGIEDAGESNDDEYWLVMSGWNFYHMIPFLGYSMEKFLKLNRVDETYFSDSVTRCAHCCVYDHNDDGYTYNHRHTDDGPIGINCGCFKDYAKENLGEYVNDHSKAIELNVAEELEENGKLIHLERFIGGMTDGRGGSWGGERTREGHPKEVLSEYLEKSPDAEFIFTHDESGQFQTYFSIWQVKTA